jgi:cell division protein FtsA
MSHPAIGDEPSSNSQPGAGSNDLLRGGRWLGRMADFARRMDHSRVSAGSGLRPGHNIPPEHLVVIVSVSSRRVSATVAALHPTHGDKVVAHKSIDCDWHRLSQGGKREAVADSVRLACDSAGVEAYSIYLSMTDASINSRLAVGWADPGDEMVLTEHERLWALKRARDQATGADQELVDAIPVHWTVRDRAGEREVEDPIGERGSRLTCQALLITARRGYRDELAALVEGLGLELEGIIAQPVALFRGISGALQRKGTTVVLDCGARCTTVLVRRRDKLVHVETHAFGGDDLTRLLVQRLGISAQQAEDLKRDLDLGVRAEERDSLVGQQFIWSDIRERHRLMGPAVALVSEALGTFFRERAQELRDQGHLVQQGQVHLFGRGSSLGGLALFLKDIFNQPVVLGSGHKQRDPSAELADVLVSGLVCTAADLRRMHLAGQASRLRKTASGVWSWLTHKMG